MKSIPAALLIAITLTSALFSCGEQESTPREDSVPVAKEDVPEFEALTISVDESNVNTLMILLAKDGTINRKGTLADTSDHNFLMGITDQSFIDSVNAGISTDLLAYCSSAWPRCDTTAVNTKVELTFASRNGQKGLTYCVEGNFDQLPEPIRNYILNAQRITAAWHEEQMKMISK